EVVSELISNDLLTPQPTETQDDQNYNEISTISDTPQEGKSTIDELQANNTDTITVLTDLLIDNSHEEISQEKSQTLNPLDNPANIATNPENQNQESFDSNFSTTSETNLVSLLDNFDPPLDDDQKSTPNTNLDVQISEQEVNSNLTDLTN
ncbi:MAG: hypothetical protein ACKO86_24020, partial [Dolichospermum sp.]